MNKVTLTGVIVSSLLLSACQTTNPYTGEKKISKTTFGTGIGAASGAVIGALVGDGKGAAIGAAVGGLAGAATGKYMDNQEAELRKELTASGVQVKREGDNINLIMPGNITFNSSSSDISASFYPTLNAVAKVVNKFKDTTVFVGGFTDSTGSAQLNAQLSQQRANSVAQYLVSQGVIQSRVQSQGYGSQYAIASNDTPEGRAMNRRVEIMLKPTIE